MFEIGYFEFMVKDLNQGMEFYMELFGWKIDFYPGMENYAGITIKEGGLGGGIGPLNAENPLPAGTLVYVNVPSVDEYVEKAVKLGATVVMPKMALPDNMGAVAVIKDPGENVFGIWAKG